MAEVTINRYLDAAPERVFEDITKTERLLKWWGPEGLHVPEHAMDFSQTGAWYSVMQSAEGNRFKVSGDVLSVDPPRSVSLTWAWHDETDQRGHESHVVMEIAASGAGAELTIRHTGLEDEESAASHQGGWNSALNKLERMAAEQGD